MSLVITHQSFGDAKLEIQETLGLALSSGGISLALLASPFLACNPSHPQSQPNYLYPLLLQELKALLPTGASETPTSETEPKLFMCETHGCCNLAS